VAAISALALLAAAAPPTRPTKPAPPSIKPPGNPLQKPGEKTGDQLVRMNMSADVARIAPGEKFLLAFVFNIEPHWHIYWENSGSSGAPTEIEVKAPANFVVGKTLFPRPQMLSSPEGVTYGYEGRVTLFVEITPPDNALGAVNFSAEASWLVCKDICKMGSAKAMLALPFGQTSVPGATPAEVDPAVAVFKSRLPGKVTDVSGASVEFDGKQLVIGIPAAGKDAAEFFPNPCPGVEFGDARFEQRGGTMHTIVPVTLEPNNSLGKPMRLAGVVGLGRELSDPCYAFDVPLADDGRPQRN
jgi:thiol:disulfide interchange protein DsbD